MIKMDIIEFVWPIAKIVPPGNDKKSSITEEKPKETSENKS